MNTKILFSGLVLATSLFAWDGAHSKDKMMAHHEEFTCKAHMHQHGFLAQFSKLNLSREQKEQMHTIMREQMQKMPHVSDAFSENRFDKELFMKLEQQKHDQMLQNRADTIEKIYNILSDAQKKEFKEMIDKRHNRFMQKEKN